MVQVSVPLPKVYRFVTVEHVDETDVGCRGQKPNLHSFFSGLGKELFSWTCHFNVSRCFRDFSAPIAYPAFRTCIGLGMS